MKLPKKMDIFINGLLPVIACGSIYFFWGKAHLAGFVRNQLPDGLWAYALCSCLLIIWNRKINVFWILTMFIAAVGFEVLQYLKIINGSGDIIDVATYILFAAAAIFANRYFITLFIPKTIKE